MLWGSAWWQCCCAAARNAASIGALAGMAASLLLHATLGTAACSARQVGAAVALQLQGGHAYLVAALQDVPALQTYDFGMWDFTATRLNPDGSAWGVPLDVQANQ